MRKLLVRVLLSLAILLASLVSAHALAWQTSALLNTPAQTFTKTARVWAAADNNGFHTAYKDPNTNILYYRRLYNGNLTGPFDTGARNSYGNHEICEALNGDVWVTWENWLPDAQGGEQIHACRTTNGGVNWAHHAITNYVYASGEGGQAKNPGICPIGTGTTANVMSLTWRAKSNRMYHQLWNGSSWTGNIQDWPTDNSYAAEGYCRSLADGSIYRTYGREVSGVWQIFYRRYDGANWGPEFQVSQCTSSADFPSRADIGVNAAGQILICWDDDSKIWGRYYDPATGWGSVVQVDDGYNVALTSIPGRNDFYIVYSGGPNKRCAGRRLLNGVWSAADRVSIGLPDGFTPDMDISAAPDGTLYAVFEYWANGAAQQYYSVCRDFSGGADVTPPSTPVVSDDGVSTDVSTYLHFTWSQSEDPESGVDHYEFSIGTSPGATDVIPWLYFGVNYERYQLGTYQPGVYYMNVRATNRAGLTSAVGSSNGITITAVNTPYTFSAPETLSASAYKCEYPSLAKSSDGGLHLVFSDYNNNSHKVIYRKLFGGAWGAAETLTEGSDTGAYPDVTEDIQGRTHAVYGSSASRENVTTIERVKNGAAWGAPAAVSADSTMDWYPRLANGPSGRVWLGVNGNGSSYTVKAAYKDAAWSGFTDLGTSSRYGNPDLASGPDGTAHMAWVQGSEIRYSKNTGAGWSAPVAAVTETGANGVRIAVDSNGFPALIWRGASAAPGATICFSRWNGSSWTPRQVIGFGFSASIAGDSAGNIHVAFSMYDSDNHYMDEHYDVWHMVHNGTSWSTATNLSHSLGMSNGAAIEAIGNDVHVAWSDAATGTAVILYSEAAGGVVANSSISGVVRDSLGNPVADATVSSSSGGYRAVTNASGAYAITGILPGTYTFTATKSYYGAQASQTMELAAGQSASRDFTISEVPPSPVTSFVALPSDTIVRLYWTNPANGNFTGTMVRCRTSGFPTSPADGDLVCDQSGAPGSFGAFVHPALTNGVTYYYAAFAHTAAGTYSGASTTLTTPAATTISESKTKPAGMIVDLHSRVVTAVFSADGYIYVQEDNGTSGIRVDTTATGIEVGHRVDAIGGRLSILETRGVSYEPTITGATVTKCSDTKYQPRLVAMGSKGIGGGETSSFAGVTGATGINSIGMLVKIAGRVDYKEGDVLIVNDGAGGQTALSDGTLRAGVKVRCDAPFISEGDIISATGVIVGDVPGGWDANGASIRCRSVSDIRRYYPETPTTGTISGYVRDTSNNPIPGASVTATGGYTATAGADGTYTLTDLPVSTYSVTASKATFASQTQTGVAVAAGGTTSCNFQLALGPMPVVVDTCSMSSTTLYANDTTQYAVTLKASDPNGVGDIKDMRFMFDLDTAAVTPSSSRGYISWGQTTSDLTLYGGNWSLSTATGGGYYGWVTDNWGYQYITPASCATSTSGNQRTVTFTFKAKPVWGSVGPVSGNYIATYCRDSTSNTGWQKFEGLTFSVSDKGALSGYVRDASNAPISGATVSTTTGGYTATTSATGAYSIPNVTGGTYSLVASKSGYVSQTKGVTAVAGSTVATDFTLSVVAPASEKLLNGNFEGAFNNCGWWAGYYPTSWGFAWRGSPSENSFCFNQYAFGGTHGKVAKVSVTSRGMEAGWVQVVSGLTPGSSYTFSAQAYQFSDGSNVWIAADPNGGTTLPTRNVHFDNIPSQWNSSSVTGTVGLTGAVSVFIWVWNQWADGDVYIDNASLMAQ